MPSDNSLPTGLDTTRGLPPVVPPSGKFMIQLFLVPFLIVGAIIGFLLLINWWVGGPRSPEYFLKKLDDANADIRWRGAEELAQVLQRDKQLAANPHFALELTERLQKALQTVAQEEKLAATRTLPGMGAEADRDRGLREASREHVLFLSACVGSMSVPVGAPLLSEMALAENGGDPKAVARKRWWAVWTLAKHGEQLQQFGKLPEESRKTILAELDAETASPNPDRANWAKLALGYFQGPMARSLQPLGVDRALIRCAQDPNPFLREMSAFAMNYWLGTPAENAKLDEALARLAFDDGHGEEILADMREGTQQASRPVTRIPGLQVRYNATVALARRGSDKLRMPVLKEMLDEPTQRENFRLKRPDGTETVDEHMVVKTLEAAMLALQELHRRQPQRDLTEVMPLVETLTQHKNVYLRTTAEQTRLGLEN